MEKLKTLLRTNLLQYTPTTSLGFKIALPSAIAATSLLIFWESVSANHELIRNIGLVCAALIGFPMLIWRTQIADRQASTGEASHTAETYTKAIEQLGAKDADGKPSMELRLGGLYALENIARTNEKYHQQIMEVLCAYVRMHAIKPVKTPSTGELNEMIEAGDLVLSEDDPSPRVDIQTALTIIGRRNTSFDGLMRLDLAHTKLDGYKLNEANLIGANLSRASLTVANLIGANLTEALLLGANLTEALLIGANLTKADFTGANLTKAYFTGANFSNAIFIEANLTRANLTEANLTRVKFIRVKFNDADFTDANLADVTLQSANIEGVRPEEKYKLLLTMKQQQEQK